MTITLWSAGGVSMVALHEDVVVLDISEDRYECLVDAASWLTPAPDGSLAVSDPALADDLIQAGLAMRRPSPPRPVCPPAARALEPRPPGSRLATVRAGLVAAAATASFHNRRLSALVAPLPASPACGADDEERLSALVGAVRAAAPFIPFEGECLHRAYVLRRWLHHEGYRPMWVFGVRTWPFAAHCWLQINALVVGDTLDRVRHYTPIRAV
ncbi:lasso peptide biosynthesis B2 protein [Brevundimonas sp.]|jgi:Transglutaminase-like superfamily|uniref:lasso peptide biosynthesis B2 protein n=1 Tax=Brevundimonas sp. TaxID=1871086 RepID=UPI00356892D9